MESPKIQYGLLYTRKGRILNHRQTSDSSEVSYHILDDSFGEPWLLDDYNNVLMAKWASEDHYNSSYEEPVNPFHPLDLQVIKVVTISTIAESDIAYELTLVNAELKRQGYAEIDPKKYVEGG